MQQLAAVENVFPGACDLTDATGALPRIQLDETGMNWFYVAASVVSLVGLVWIGVLALADLMTEGDGL